jgi:hypothetical protein
VTATEAGVNRHHSLGIGTLFGRRYAVAPTSIVREHLGASRLRSLRSPLTRP